MQSKLHSLKHSNGRIRKHLTLFRSQLLGRTNKGTQKIILVLMIKKVLYEYTGQCVRKGACVSVCVCQCVYVWERKERERMNE